MSKILCGVSEICDFGKMSRNLFYKFVKLGMPAAFIDGRWYAHADNIDGFFQRITNVSNKGRKLPEEE